MTTPSIDTELYLPKTYIFERKGRAYSDLAFMTRRGSALDYVYLPKGLSSVTITATGMGLCRMRVWLFGAGGYIESVTDMMGVGGATQRLWMGQLSNPGEASAGLWLKVQAQNVTTAGMNAGSVSVQIINFPPEN
mgnify:CR=1 FL=1